MARQAGDTLHASSEIIGHDDPDENTDAGDAVAVGPDGNLVQADGTDELFGIRARLRQSRDIASVVHDGVVVARVADGVEGGDALDTSGTVGELDAEGGGPALALSDEGGTYRGASIPDGHAAVLVR